MSFWDLKADPASIALSTPVEEALSYRSLAEAVEAFDDALPSARSRQLGFILGTNSFGTAVAYLAALRRRDVACLLNPGIRQDLKDDLVRQYEPEWIYESEPTGALAGYEPVRDRTSGVLWTRLRAREDHPALHPDLAVLLSTSGSTGSPKMVRLSFQNLAANAAAIAAYLGLGESERAMCPLPLHYSYGLSVLNSHLACGASVFLTDASIVQSELWEQGKRYQATSMPGVPSTYLALRRFRLEEQIWPSLRTLTQAGGRLDPNTARHFWEFAQRTRRRLFLMYGQTEAAPRISYVPPERLPDKIASVGVPVPGGALDLDRTTGELVYRGPNVMLGYAARRDELARGDDCRGVLRTGDVGSRDEDGFFSVTGRLARFIKLSGIRVSLDEVETLCEKAVAKPVAATGADDDLQVWVQSEERSDVVQVGQVIRQSLKLHPSLMKVRMIAELPMHQAGKKDYRALPRE